MRGQPPPRAGWWPIGQAAERAGVSGAHGAPLRRLACWPAWPAPTAAIASTPRPTCTACASSAARATSVSRWTRSPSCSACGRTRPRQPGQADRAKAHRQPGRTHCRDAGHAAQPADAGGLLPATSGRIAPSWMTLAPTEHGVPQRPQKLGQNGMKPRFFHRSAYRYGIFKEPHDQALCSSPAGTPLPPCYSTAPRP